MGTGIGVCIMEIVSLELEPESKEVEDADEGGKFVPSHNLVYSLEDLDENAAGK